MHGRGNTVSCRTQDIYIHSIVVYIEKGHGMVITQHTEKGHGMVITQHTLPALAVHTEKDY